MVDVIAVEKGIDSSDVAPRFAMVLDRMREDLGHTKAREIQWRERTKSLATMVDMCDGEIPHAVRLYARTLLKEYQQSAAPTA